MWGARGLGFIWLRVPVSEIILNVLPMKPRKGRTGGGFGAWRGPGWGCARGRRSLWKGGARGAELEAQQVKCRRGICSRKIGEFKGIETPALIFVPQILFALRVFKTAYK